MARGPSSLNAHTTLAKSFELGEGARIQLRFEAFNVLNRKNYNNPQLATNNVNFGRITGAGGSAHVPVGRPHDVLNCSGKQGRSRDSAGDPLFVHRTA